MARTSTKKVDATAPTTTSSTTSKQPTAAEMREWYEKNKRNIENYVKAKDASAITNLKDITKNQTKTVSSFNKETLRTYLKNIGSNEKNLRNLSRYLYYRCQSYHRLIVHNANMFELGARTVVPQYDLLKPPAPDKLLKDYYETLNMLNVMNLQQELLKAYICCFREDIFYGFTFLDETGFFILPFDQDYAKIAGLTSNGSLVFAIDCTYFRSRQELLEFWGEPFQSCYKEYEKTNQKWQIPDINRQICLKFRLEDIDVILPPFAGMLNSIINLIDLEDLQQIQVAQQIFKLLTLKMDTISGAKNENEFKVSPDIMIEYFNRMINECLPDYVAAALVPGDIEAVSFNDVSKDADTNKLSKAMQNFFDATGSIILNGSSVSGSTAFESAIEADTQFALSSLLPQTQSWLNRFLQSNLSNASKVTFFEVSSLTKEKLSKKLLESCQYGFSNILAYNSLNGISEKDTIALNYLENDCLGLVDKFKPLQSSHTQTGDGKTGRPELDTDELTDNGEANRDKDTAS